MEDIIDLLVDTANIFGPEGLTALALIPLVIFLEPLLNKDNKEDK